MPSWHRASGSGVVAGVLAWGIWAALAAAPPGAHSVVVHAAVLGPRLPSLPFPAMTLPPPTTTTSTTVHMYDPHPSSHVVSRSAPIHAAAASAPVVVASAPSGGVAACIRQHEWNPREGYATYDPPFYGAYQFDIPTWHDYGGYYRPDQAPPSVQDAKFWLDWNSDSTARRHAEWPNSSRECGF